MGLFSGKKDKAKKEQRDKKKKNIEQGLHKTKESLGKRILGIFKRKTIDEDFYDELEEVLIDSDVGIETTLDIINQLKKNVKEKKLKSNNELVQNFKEIVEDIIIDPDFEIGKDKLNIIFVVGVNGVGKTTSIAKLSNSFKSKGNNVIIAACDTFRAAAVEQLTEWADRIGIHIVKNDNNDPGSVLYQAIDQAISKKAEVLIVDTAGRLHNRQNLMKEIEKLNRIIDKKTGDVDITKENMLVIDANTGQNAYKQADDFHKIIKIDSIFLAKLDSTSKGGIVIPISHNLKIPVKYCGLGEKLDDIIQFEKHDYIESIIGDINNN